jgi:hypothetical protein
MIRGSVDGIATKLQAGLFGVRNPVMGNTFCACLESADRLLGPNNVLLNAYRGCFHGGKRSERECNHFPPVSAAVTLTELYLYCPFMPS